MVFLSSRISPFTSTVIFFDKSPVGDGRRHVGDVAHLARKITGHEVHAVGKVLPRTGNAFDHGLAAELSFGTHFAGHARHFRRKRPQLIHHRIDGVLELEELALHVDRDLLRQVAVGDGRRHGRDVTDLAGKITGHEIHVIGEILPRAGHALHPGLPAELAVGTHFAGHARHFRRERAQLIHHAIDGLRGAQELALQRPLIDFQRHRLREVTLRHGPDHAGRFHRRMDQIADERVDRVNRVCPGTTHVAQRCALREPPRLANHLADPFEFTNQLLIPFENVVERVRHLLRDAVFAKIEPDRKVTFFERVKCSKELTRV